MDGFLKYKECPTSQELLAYRDPEISPRKLAALSKHLAECEFCFAELEFYSHYPQIDDLDDARQIPAPLYELAEALLTRRKPGTSPLESLAVEEAPKRTKKK